MTAIKRAAANPGLNTKELEAALRVTYEQQKAVEEGLKDKANASTIQGLSQKITNATEAFTTATNSFSLIEQANTQKLSEVNSKLSTQQQTLSDLNNTKADAQAVSNALNLTNTALITLRTDYTDNKPYKGTSTQTITNQPQVLIAHGIPANAPVPATSRTPILTAMTEAAGGYRNVSVDATNIIIEYDVAVVSGTNGWVMKWEL